MVTGYHAVKAIFASGRRLAAALLGHDSGVMNSVQSVCAFPRGTTIDGVAARQFAPSHAGDTPLRWLGLLAAAVSGILSGSLLVTIGWFVSSWRGGRIVGLVLVGLGAAGPILAMAAVAAVQTAPNGNSGDP